MRGWLAHQGMQARAASSHAELLGLQRLQMRYPLRSLRSFSLAMTSRPRSHPPLLMRPCKHAQRAAMRSCRGFHTFRLVRACRPLCSLCRFSLAMAHTHAATAPRTHVVAGPRHGAAEGPTITPYPPLVTDIPPTLLVAQVLHKARAASHPQQHCAPCSSITLHSSITEAEAARSASTCLRS